MQRVIVVLFFLIVSALPGRAFAGAWTQKPGGCYAKLWNRLLVGSAAYADGLRDVERDIEGYVDNQINLYAECGVTNEFTVAVFGAPVGFASGDDGKSETYVGPFGIGLRYGLITSGDFRLALEGRYSYASGVGDSDVFSRGLSLTNGKPIVYIPAIENHYGELAVQFGRGFQLGSLSSWFSGEVGFRFNSSKEIDHALTAFLQWGVQFGFGLMLDLHVALYEPYFESVSVVNVAGVGQTRYLGVGLGASYWVTKWLAFNVGFDGVAYAASNAATPSISFGIESKFDL